LGHFTPLRCIIALGGAPSMGKLIPGPNQRLPLGPPMLLPPAFLELGPRLAVGGPDVGKVQSQS
jgi:hypothetical protein